MTIKVKTQLKFKEGFKDLSKFEKYVSRINAESFSVGYSTDQIHSSEGNNEDSIDMAYLATILHEGTQDGRIPPRPFLRATLQQLTSGAKFRFLRKPFMNYLSSIDNKQYTVDQMLLDLGKIVRTEVQKNFGRDNTISLDPNAQTTIRLKKRDKSNNPLVDTGELRDSMQVRTSKGGQD